MQFILSEDGPPNAGGPGTPPAAPMPGSPPGGPAGADPSGMGMPPGGPDMGAGGPPPMGGMGGGGGGGMPGDPSMGMGGQPGGGGMPPMQPPTKYKVSSVWDVFERILQGKPVNKAGSDKKNVVQSPQQLPQQQIPPPTAAGPQPGQGNPPF